MANDPGASGEAVVVTPDGTEYPVPPGGLTIGRQSGAGVVLQDPLVSRRHAHIFGRGEAFYVSDLGSVNGTMVNGRRLTIAQPLSDGDVLRIGDATLTFRIRREQPPLVRRPVVASGPAAGQPGTAFLARPRSDAGVADAVAPATPQRLRITVSGPAPHPRDTSVDLKLSGVLDIGTADQFLGEYRRLLAAGAAHFTLDLHDLEYLDSSGLGMLVGLVREVRAVGGTVRLQRMQPVVRGIIELTRVDRLFTIE